MINFYDTSSLLLKSDVLFEESERFAISSITLEELEHIKTAANKDADIKYAANRLTKKLHQHMGKYDVEIYSSSMAKPIEKAGIYLNNDAKILACGLSYQKKQGEGRVRFITNDICLKHLANLFFSTIGSVNEEEHEYLGCKDIQMDEDEMGYFYSNLSQNIHNLYTNEYLIIRNNEGEIVDRLCWDGEIHRPIKTKPIQSKWFGQVKAYNNDTYQLFAIDSLHNNQLTVLRGRSGTGKSYLGLTYLFSLLEKHEIDKIYIMCNPVATKDAAKLGFYPGEKNTKLLDSQIGNFLFGKFGDRLAVEKLIEDGKIILVPVSDCRGMDIANCGIYITEAQNSTVSLMKLMLQRIGENTKCVIEGDDKTQVDLLSYENENNGLKRLSKVFRGQPYYGEITLQNCYRSKIANHAENM